MIKYILRGVIERKTLMYGGQHYALKNIFTSNIYQATMYTVRDDALLMKSALDAYFDTQFKIVMIKVTIQEVQER